MQSQFHEFLAETYKPLKTNELRRKDNLVQRKQRSTTEPEIRILLQAEDIDEGRIGTGTVFDFIVHEKADLAKELVAFIRLLKSRSRAQFESKFYHCEFQDIYRYATRKDLHYAEIYQAYDDVSILQETEDSEVEDCRAYANSYVSGLRKKMEGELRGLATDGLVQGMLSETSTEQKTKSTTEEPKTIKTRSRCATINGPGNWSSDESDEQNGYESRWKTSKQNLDERIHKIDKDAQRGRTPCPQCFGTGHVLRSATDQSQRGSSSASKVPNTTRLQLRRNVGYTF